MELLQFQHGVDEVRPVTDAQGNPTGGMAFVLRHYKKVPELINAARALSMSTFAQAKFYVQVDVDLAPKLNKMNSGPATPVKKDGGSPSTPVKKGGSGGSKNGGKGAKNGGKGAKNWGKGKKGD